MAESKGFTVKLTETLSLVSTADITDSKAFDFTERIPNEKNPKPPVYAPAVFTGYKPVLIQGKEIHVSLSIAKKVGTAQKNVSAKKHVTI
jgi:hypothetical protein